MDNGKRVMIVAGGTGGHIFPGLAIADSLAAGGATVMWLGGGGLEVAPIEQRGWPLYIVPFRPPSGLGGAWRLAVAIVRAVRVLRRARPQVVLGMGGYPSLPGGLAARLCRLPLVIHEQNAVLGRANRLLARFANLALSGFPNVFANGRFLGNPVRQDFLTEATAAAAAAAETVPPLERILVLGGSQGAAALNRLLPPTLALLAAGGRRCVVQHQCGRGHLPMTQAAYAASGLAHEDVQVQEFIGDVAAAMRAADLVICRAGAATLSELAAVAVAAILIPYPFAAANHQLANARFFVEQEAAVLCEEESLNADILADNVRRLDNAKRDDMRRRMRLLARPNAAADIAACCLEYGEHAA